MQTSAIAVLTIFSFSYLRTASSSPLPDPMQENAIVSSVNGDISQRMTRQFHYFDPPPFYQYDNVNGGGKINNCAQEGVRRLSCRAFARYFHFLVKRSTPPLQISEDEGRRPYKGQSAGRRRHRDRDEITSQTQSQSRPRPDQ